MIIFNFSDGIDAKIKIKNPLNKISITFLNMPLIFIINNSDINIHNNEYFLVNFFFQKFQ